MPVAILWFRRDLRLADHSALTRALQSGHVIVPVYVHAPEEESPWPLGAASRWWLHQSLAALDATLRAHGSRLCLGRGPTVETLLRVAKNTYAEALFFQRALEPAALARESAVSAALRDAGLRVEGTPGATLFEPNAIRTQGGSPFRVFTPFWNACQAATPPPEPLPAPRNLPAPPAWPESLPLDALGLLPRIPWYRGFESAWTPGEAGARTRLGTFVKAGATGYATERDLPATDGTSRLSPHLAFGELSPRQVWHAIRRAHRPKVADPYLRQLGWRDFAQHLLFHFPHSTERPLRPEFERMPWREDADALLATWQHGRTGIPIVDAGMRQLWATGWMHNRVRMLVASFLTKNARVPWQHGARWFWDTLVDADLANNTMGWQWVAGCGTDAAPYFRIFNPVQQGQRFDPQGDYVRRWVPELAALPAEWIHAPWEAPPLDLAATDVRLGETYPLPVLDLKQTRAEALAAYDAMRGK